MNVAILGTGITNFGELWSESLESLAKDACGQALESAKVKLTDLDLLIVGNKLLQQLENRAHVGALVASVINFKGPSWHTEAACASGGVAVRQGIMAIQSGMAQKVMVVGVEKMTDVDLPTISRSLMSAASEAEIMAGATFPALYALMAQAYLKKYHLPESILNSPSIKNHFHASLNPQAQFREPVTHTQISHSGMVASPLRQLHCSPISDGAAAVILSNSPSKPGQVSIIASAQTSDSLSICDRDSLTGISATANAAKYLFSQTKLTLKDVNLFELHDCFSIAEIMACEDLGLSKRGEAGEAIEKGLGWLGKSQPVINISGGLKACGHPVGATGVKQIVEISRQLQGLAGKRQVKDAHTGLTHNVGGTGGTVVMHLLSNNGEIAYES